MHTLVSPPQRYNVSRLKFLVVQKSFVIVVPNLHDIITGSPDRKILKMKFTLRSILEAVLISYTPTNSSYRVEHLAANPLDARSDRIVPGFILPAAKSTEPSPNLTPPPPPATVTITSISTSTSLITTTVDVTVNATYYVTDTETFTTAIPTTSLTTSVTNSTVTITPTRAGPTHASSMSAVPDAKKPVSASGVLAIISGVTNLALLLAMFFLVRRFYRMYRQERVLRKQMQTEGVELKQAGAKDDEWWVTAKQ